MAGIQSYRWLSNRFKPIENGKKNQWDYSNAVEYEEGIDLGFILTRRTFKFNLMEGRDQIKSFRYFL
jgi:hypothetical protein